VNRVAETAPPAPALVRILWFVVALLMLIGIAIVIRRSVALLAPSPGPPRFPEAAALDASFGRHSLLTMIHIMPGLLFVLLAPFQFVGRLRNSKSRLHRWMGRIALCSGIVIGVTALVMSPQMAIGGANEIAATMFFAVIFLFSLIRAFVYIRRGNFTLHREWMIRAFAIAFAVATIRPIMGIFFATRSLTHLTPHDFFGIAFWLGFTIHLIAAEAWINYTRPAEEMDILKRSREH
jgi:hypothetical protein